MRWPTVQFGDVLVSNKRPYTLGPTEDADLVGMRLYGLGPFHRENKPASKILKKTHFVIRTGDIIYNKLFAWKGTFGVVPSALDGMFVSDKFPTYELDETRVYKPFLEWYFRRPLLWHEAQVRSKGSAALSKLTLNPPQFLELPLPLPPIDKQHLVVERIKELVSTVDHALSFRTSESRLLLGRRIGVGQEGRHLLNSALVSFEQFLGPSDGFLGDIMTESPRAGPSFPVADTGRGIPVVMPSATTGFGYNSLCVSYGVYASEVPEKDLLRQGDILFPRGNKPDNVGNCGVYNGDPTPVTYANLFMRIRVDQSQHDPHFLNYWLMTPSVRDHVKKHTKGTSPSVQKINSTGVRGIPVHKSIPLKEQRRWIRRFSDIDKKCQRLGTAIIKSDALTRALIPSIVDRAYNNGQLL